MSYGLRGSVEFGVRWVRAPLSRPYGTGDWLWAIGTHQFLVGYCRASLRDLGWWVVRASTISEGMRKEWWAVHILQVASGGRCPPYKLHVVERYVRLKGGHAT